MNLSPEGEAEPCRRQPQAFGGSVRVLSVTEPLKQRRDRMGGGHQSPKAWAGGWREVDSQVLSWKRNPRTHLGQPGGGL